MAKKFRAASLALAAALAMATALQSAAGADESNGIWIVGALHALHETEESFSYTDLRDLIEAIDPDVMLLEVRPDELTGRKETPGRPEYPAVVWPMLENSGTIAVAMEPGDPLFTEMVTAAADRAEAFERDKPEEHALLSSFRRSLNTALGEHWSSLDRTHDGVTHDLTRASYIVNAVLAGERAAGSQRRWDSYMVEQVRRTIHNNPTRKILVLGSYRNRHVFVEQLHTDYRDRLIDMEAWLRSRAGR